MALNNTWDRIESTDTFRTFHPEAAEYTFWTHGMLSRTENKLGHKTCLNKFTKIQVIAGIFSDYNYETKNQQQEEIWKDHQYMEIK